MCQATGVWSGSEPTCLIERMSYSLFLNVSYFMFLDLKSQEYGILSCNFIVHTASYNLTTNINCYTNSLINSSHGYSSKLTVVLLLSCLLHVLLCFIRYNFRDNGSSCGPYSILSGSWWCGHHCSYCHHGHHHLCMSSEKEEDKEKVSVALSTKELVATFLCWKSGQPFWILENTIQLSWASEI